MEKEHLHLLIHEEIYRLPADQTDNEVNASENTSKEVKEPAQVSEPQPEYTEKVLVKDEKESKTVEIPAVEQPKELPFAVFHSSTNEQEVALLHKIIAACKLPADEYQIFEKGFDKSVKFKKALVFVSEARAFYSPIPYKGSEFLCSKPLSDLNSNQQEKAKLWSALQKFIA